MITEITQQEYNALDVNEAKLVEFYSKTCGPCKMLAFVLKDIDRQFPDFPIYTIDFDANIELKEQLGVKGFPTMLFFKDGVEVNRMAGLKQKPLIAKAVQELL